MPYGKLNKLKKFYVNTMTGTVKWFDEGKGFGFIQLMAAKMYYISLQSKVIASNIS